MKANYTQCQIEPDWWSQKAKRPLFWERVSAQINDILTTYRANILQAYDQLVKEGKEPNSFAIKHRLLAGFNSFLQSSYNCKNNVAVNLLSTMLYEEFYPLITRGTSG